MNRLFFSLFVIFAFTMISCDNAGKKGDEPKTEKKTGQETAQTPVKKEEPKVDPGDELLKKELAKTDNPIYEISVKHGSKKLDNIKIMLFPAVAPEHCRNFDSLVAIKFFDRTAFHRVIPGFMIQGGDPNTKNKPQDTWGMGDPSQRKIKAEFNPIHHRPGIVSAARSNDPNSATSQFFICVGAPANLDGQYTVYGKVIDGMTSVNYIADVERDRRDAPTKKVEMKIRKVENK